MASEVLERLRELVNAANSKEKDEDPPSTKDDPMAHGESYRSCDPGVGVDCTRAELEHSIAIDIAARRAVGEACWRKLDTCFKWAMVRTYIAERGLDPDAPVVTTVRHKLMAKQLPDLLYDVQKRRVVHLGIPEVDRSC